MSTIGRRRVTFLPVEEGGIIGPILEDEGTVTKLSARTSHTVNLPATVSTGSQLFLVCGLNVDGGFLSVSDPSGWSRIAASIYQSYGAHHVVWTKTADGSEGGTTVNFTTNYNIASATFAISVAQYGGRLVNTAFGSSGQANPPASGSFGAVYTNCICVVSGNYRATADSDPSPGFTKVSASYSGITFGIQTGLNVSTLDPGVYSYNSPNQWNTVTLLIRGTE